MSSPSLRRFSFHSWIIAAALLAGLLLRLPILIEYKDSLNWDESLVGLVSLEILEGRIPTFAFDQIKYFGPQECAVSALFFALGPDNALTLRLSVLFCAFLAACFYYLGARRAIGREGAACAMAFVFLGPLTLTIYSLLPRGGHIAALTFSALVFYLTARIITSTQPKTLDYFFLGAAAGFGVWASQGTLIHSIPAALILIAARPRDLIRPALPAALAGTAIGGLPFWKATLESGMATFDFGHGQARESAWLLLADMAKVAANLPVFMGYNQLPEPLGMAGAGLMAVIFIMGAWFFFAGGSYSNPAKLVFLYGAAVILFNVFLHSYGPGSRYGGLAYRYLIPATGGMAMILGFVFQRLYSRHGRVGASLLIVVLSFNALACAMAVRSGAWLQYEVNLDPPYLAWKKPLKLLESIKADRVYTDELSAEPITFASSRRIIAASFFEGRLTSTAISADASAKPAFLFATPSQGAMDFSAQLRALGGEFKEADDGVSRVFYDYSPANRAFSAIPAAGMEISANPQPEQEQGMLDGNMATLWAAAQRGMESVTIKLAQPERIGRVDLVRRDMTPLPRFVEIKTSMDGDKWEAAAAAPTQNTLYLAGFTPIFAAYEGFNQYIFPPRLARFVRISQTNANEDDWLVNEAVLYAASEANTQPVRTDFDKAIAFLRDIGAREVISDFYFSANVFTKSGGTLTANIRHAARRPDAKMKWRFTSGELDALAVNFRDAPLAEQTLLTWRWSFSKKEMGEYVIFHNMKSPLAALSPIKAKVRASASENGAAAPDMTDGAMDTVWRSGAPMRDGMSVTLETDKPQAISALRLEAGEDVYDLALPAEIYYDKGGGWTRVEDASITPTNLYWTGAHLFADDASSTFYFSPIVASRVKIICRRSHPHFNWSIREASLLGGASRPPG